MVVDWVELVWDLVQRGHTLASLEALVGIDRNTLRRYYEDGSQPPHWRGELLLAAWCSVLSRPAAAAPRTALYIAPRIVRPRDQQRGETARAPAAAIEDVWR